MTTLELKSALIQQINDISDISFLKALKKIVETKIESEVHVIPTEIKKEIKEAQKQSLEGKISLHADVEKEISLWLNEK